ncbi:hypothetical protein [Streptomyces sp. NPDC046371]
MKTLEKKNERLRAKLTGGELTMTARNIARGDIQFTRALWQS